MKELKNIYKIIFLTILMTILLFIAGSNTLAVTQPALAPDGESWEGWFCAQSGISYWNKYSYYGNYNSYKYQKATTITKSSSEGEAWHILGYIINYADEKGAGFYLNHYMDSSGHHGTNNTNAKVQSALWKVIRNNSTIYDTLDIEKPSYACSCGDSLYQDAVDSWNGGNPSTRYSFKISIWKDNLNGVVNDRYYVRQPLLKIESVSTIDAVVKLRFYKRDKDNEGLAGAKINVTVVDDATVTGTLTESESSYGRFGTLKIKPKTNDGTIKIKIKETKVPEGYIGMSGEPTLTITYNTTTGAVTSISGSNSDITTSTKEGVGIIKVENEENTKPVKVYFYKRAHNISGELEKVSGAEINVEAVGTNVYSIDPSNLTVSGDNGYLRICKSNSKKFRNRRV